MVTVVMVICVVAVQLLLQSGDLPLEEFPQGAGVGAGGVPGLWRQTDIGQDFSQGVTEAQTRIQVDASRHAPPTKTLFQVHPPSW